MSSLNRLGNNELSKKPKAFRPRRAVARAWRAAMKAVFAFALWRAGTGSLRAQLSSGLKIGLCHAQAGEFESWCYGAADERKAAAGRGALPMPGWHHGLGALTP